jgi:hypothetical protein
MWLELATKRLDITLHLFYGERDGGLLVYMKHPKNVPIRGLFLGVYRYKTPFVALSGFIFIRCGAEFKTTFLSLKRKRAQGSSPRCNFAF